MDMLVQIVRCIHLKAALTDVEPNPPLNFWRLTYGGLMDLAVLEWCKIFGTNGEPSHWKGVVEDPAEFRSSLLKYLGITAKDWEDYWNHMKSYRDEFVAHSIDDSQVSNYPDLQIALDSSYFYYDYLRTVLDDETMERLEVYCSRFFAQSREIAQIALNATKNINEKVY